MSFEEIKQDAEAAVRRVASFLKIEATEEAVRETAQAVDFEAMKRMLHTHTKMRAGRASVLGGRQLKAFSRQMLRAFERKLIEPARACGMEFVAAEPRGSLALDASGPTPRNIDPEAHATALAAAAEAKRAAATARSALRGRWQQAARGSLAAPGGAAPVPPHAAHDATRPLSIDEKLSLAGRGGVGPTPARHRPRAPRRPPQKTARPRRPPQKTARRPDVGCLLWSRRSPRPERSERPRSPAAKRPRARPLPRRACPRARPLPRRVCSLLCAHGVASAQGRALVYFCRYML